MPLRPPGAEPTGPAPILLQACVLAGLLSALPAAAQTPASLEAARWAEVDRHALAAPAEIEGRPPALARWLTEPFSSTEEKLRALYRWIADRIEYDVQAYREGRTGREPAEQVLARRISTCEGYSSLFDELARHAGIEGVVTIDGYVKDALHQRGEAFDRPNHAWNAVLIGGRWHLIDSTWGAGYDDGERYVKRFEPLYFLADPALLKASHFAEDARHRFHAEPRTVDAFRALPYTPTTLLSAVDLKLLNALPAELPKTFEHPPGTFWVEDAPMTRTLAAGSPARFRLRSDTLAEFALLNGNAWTFAPAQTEGNTLVTMPVPGPLLVLGKRTGEAGYRYLLEYEVRPSEIREEVALASESAEPSAEAGATGPAEASPRPNQNP